MTTYSSQPSNTTGVDTHMNSAFPDNAYGSDATMITGANTFSAYRRSLIKFNLSSIASNATISSAILSLWVASSTATQTGYVGVYRCKRAWTQANATWNKYDGTNAWQTAGGTGTNDYDSTEWGTTSVAYNIADGTEVQFTLSNTEMKKYIDGTYTNNGWLVKSVPEDSSSRHSWYTCDEATQTTKRPKLVIEYTVPSGFKSRTMFV
jgi:hypothetical protein